MFEHGACDYPIHYPALNDGELQQGQKERDGEHTLMRSWDDGIVAAPPQPQFWISSGKLTYHDENQASEFSPDHHSQH